MREIILCVFLALAGCAESGAEPASYKDQLVEQHLREGWIFVGINGPNLKFKRAVPGGWLVREIPYYDPTHPYEYFVAEQRTPW